MYKLVVIALFIAAASASAPLVAPVPWAAHAPLVAPVHAPLPVATSYANTWRVSHSVVPAPVVAAPVHAPLVAAPVHAPIVAHGAPLVGPHGWSHLG